MGISSYLETTDSTQLHRGLSIVSGTGSSGNTVFTKAPEQRFASVEVEAGFEAAVAAHANPALVGFGDYSVARPLPPRPQASKILYFLNRYTNSKLNQPISIVTDPQGQILHQHRLALPS